MKNEHCTCLLWIYKKYNRVHLHLNHGGIFLMEYLFCFDVHSSSIYNVFKLTLRYLIIDELIGLIRLYNYTGDLLCLLTFIDDIYVRYDKGRIRRDTCGKTLIDKKVIHHRK